MSAQNNGGPAFPTSDWDENGRAYKMHGMTLRDYFAAKAMAEMSWLNNTGSAKECYEIADEMLKAREQ